MQKISFLSQTVCGTAKKKQPENHLKTTYHASFMCWRGLNRAPLGYFYNAPH